MGSTHLKLVKFDLFRSLARIIVKLTKARGGKSCLLAKIGNCYSHFFNDESVCVQKVDFLDFQRILPYCVQVGSLNFEFTKTFDLIISKSE